MTTSWAVVEPSTIWLLWPQPSKCFMLWILCFLKNIISSHMMLWTQDMDFLWFPHTTVSPFYQRSSPNTSLIDSKFSIFLIYYYKKLVKWKENFSLWCKIIHLISRGFFCMDFFKFSDLLCDSYPYRITTWWLNLLYRQFEKWVVTVDGDWWENWRQNCWKIFICVYIFFHPEVRVVFDGNFRMHHFLQKCQEIFNDVDVLFTSEIFIIWIFRFQKPLKRYIQILPIFCNNARKKISLISTDK